MTNELRRRFDERHLRVLRRSEFRKTSPLVLAPPHLPKPAASTQSGLQAAAQLFLRLWLSLLYLAASILKWSGLVAIGFFPMLAVGAVGIFVMVFIGAGIEMLKMAAY